MMRKSFWAVIVVVAVFGAGSLRAEASDWTGYFKVDWDAVGDYASEKWNDASNYVSGWFSGNKEEVTAKASGDNLPPAVASGWDRLTGTLTDALTLRDKQETLPHSSWIPFREDQASNAKKINALLDTALGFLVNGEAGEIRKNASQLRDAIAKQRTELDSLRNQRITAPEKSSLPWKLTKGKADERIARLQEEIADSEERLNTINAELAGALKEIGLELDGSQVEILLNSVTGDDLMQNTIVFSNVKAVVAKLEELAQNDTNTLDITRRYTGMYLVLNDMLIHTQEELVRKIDDEYKPKLKGIISEAEAIRKEAMTRSNQDIYSVEQRKGFAANAQSNALTIQVANLYTELLDRQRAGTMDSIKSLRLNRDLAENTYKTVRSSWELRGLIHTGLKVFDAVGTLKMPELKVFESGVMRLEFEEINRRLRD
ncbi:MAG: hypothetical protein IJR85_11345 [Synergistaceae bacterium]|nr:hypothetical protein [Synergistaceae bacterium]